MDITKLEAARRQIETAVALYFQEADPISIHTLTAAAHGILSDVSYSMGNDGPKMLTHWVEELVQEPHRSAFRRGLREAQNFFKHADKDPSDVLKGFKTENTEILLWDSCQAYRLIARERPPLLGIFASWARITFGKAWILSADGTDLETEAEYVAPGMLQQFRSMSRRDFFDTMAPVVFRAHFGPPVRKEGGV